MAEVRNADIWVSAAPPVGAELDDFWLDTTKVPLFGITIVGSLPVPGPPPSNGTGSGDAYWDSVGHLWVWDGSRWVDQGSFQGPVGATGPVGPSGAVGATGPQGFAGVVGATGPVGPQGLVGPAGVQGPLGQQGPMGLPGPQYL